MPFKKRAPRKKTTALSKRVQRAVIRSIDSHGALAAGSDQAMPIGWRQLSEAPMMPVGLGVYNPLSKHEKEMLQTPVDLAVVRVKPTGEVFVKHIDYTRFCNRVFGVGEWALVQSGKSLSNGKTFVTPFVLNVHGKPVSSAVGEQEYFEENKKQTQGDAIEATHASALRRTLKHLGLWLELWDPEFGEDFKREHCTHDNGGWRRKDQVTKVHRNGKKQQQQREQHKEAAREADLIVDDNATISDEAVVRFWQLSRERGRNDTEVRAWLKTYGYDRVNGIKVKYYDAICKAVSAPGELPERRRSLPGGES